MGGQFLLSFNAETRRATGRGAGDEVDVRLDVDDEPRVVAVPDDLALALADDVAARAAWERLSYSRQREHVESITGAKTPDASPSRRQGGQHPARTRRRRPALATACSPTPDD